MQIFCAKEALYKAQHTLTRSWLGFEGAEVTVAATASGAADRTARTALVYGVPALVFTWSTWRAVTVFDEVLELRWHRWKAEWEQTLEAMAKQPEPGPEDSPRLDAAVD